MWQNFDFAIFPFTSLLVIGIGFLALLFLIQKFSAETTNPSLKASLELLIDENQTEYSKLRQQLQQLREENIALRQECLRLQKELQQQRDELTDEFRSGIFEQLQTLLTNYPSIYHIVQVKPELPVKNLLSLLIPLDNLIQMWGYKRIGKPWEQVPYNPQIHQPDAVDIAEGDLVYIRFVGYQDKERILCPAKVSRSLPRGGEREKN